MSDNAFVGSQAFNQLSNIHEDVIPNTGSLVLNIPIIDLMGKLDGIGLAFSLTYMLGKEGRFGLPDNWSFGLPFLSPGDYLEVNGSRYIIDPTWQDAEGYASGLKYLNNHGVEFADAVSSQPLPYGDSGLTYQYTYKDVDGSVCYFSSQGYLLMKADRFGNYIYYAYTSSNLIDYIVDSFGQKTSFGYNPNEIIITFPDGRTASIGYAAAGVSSIVDPLGQAVFFNYAQQGSFSVISTIQYPSGKKTQVNYSGVSFYDENRQAASIPVVSDLQYLDGSGNLLMHYQYAYGTHSGGNTFTGYAGGFTLSSSSDGLLDSNNTLYLYDVQISKLDASGNTLSRIDTLYSFAHVATQRNTYVYDSGGKECGYFQLNSTYNLTPNQHNQQPNYLCPKETEQLYFEGSGQSATKQKKISMAYDSYGNVTEKTVSLYDDASSEYMLNNTETATYFTQSGVKIVSLIETFCKTDCVANQVIKTTNTLTSDSNNVATSSITVSNDGGAQWESWKAVSQSYDQYGREVSTSVKWTKASMPGVQETTRSYAYSYDDSNFCVTTALTDALGFTSKLQTSTMHGKKVAVVSDSGKTTTYTYDAIGRLVSKTLPSGQKITHVYKSFVADGENSTTATNNLSYYKKFVYDELGRETASYDNGDPTDSTAQRQLGSKKYDMAGNVVEEADIFGNVTACEYNSLGKPSQTIDPQKNKIEITYDYAASTTTTIVNGLQVKQLTHEQNGRVIREDRFPNTSNSDIESQYTVRSEYTYAGYGNKLTKTVSKISDGTSVMLSKSEYRYNADSMCVSEDFVAEDGSTSTTTTMYDINSKQVSQSVTRNYDNGSSYCYKSDVIGYDALGQKISDTNRDGESETYSYNGDGLLSSKTFFDGSSIDYEYNQDGKIIKESWKEGTTPKAVSYAYDKIGRLVSVSDSSGTLGNEYAMDNALTCIIYPDGKKLTYTLDKYSRKVVQVDVSGFKTSYVYNATNQLSVVKTAADTLKYTYYQDVSKNTMFGAPKSVELTNNYVEVYGYDAFNRRNSLTRTASSNGDLMLMESSSYSALDQLISTKLSSALSADDCLNHSRIYQYDGFSQLTVDCITNASNATVSKDTYTYDANMNVLSKTSVGGAETKYTYNSIGQLTSYTVDGAAKTQTYDKNGRLVVDGDGKKYRYDLQGHLLSVAGQSDTQVYSYYPNKLLATRTAGSASTTMYYDSSQQVITTCDGATPTQFLIVGSKRFASYTNGVSPYFFGGNQHQDTVCGTSDSGLVGQAYYKSYGGTEGNLGLSASNNFAWNQEYADLDNALVYLRSRYYDPKTMRFITRDSKQVSNRYAYCNGDPVNNMDPTGHDAENWAVLGVSAGVGLGLIGAATYVALTYGAAFTAAVGGTGAVAAIGAGALVGAGAAAIGVGPVGAAVAAGATAVGVTAIADVPIGSALGVGIGSTLGAYVGGSVVGGQTGVLLGSSIGGSIGGYVGTAAGQALGFGETTVAASFSAAADMLGSATATATASIAAVGDAVGTVASTTAAATTATVAAVGDVVGSAAATAATVATTATEAVGAAATMATEAAAAVGAAVGIETAGDAALALLALVGLAFL